LGSVRCSQQKLIFIVDLESEAIWFTCLLLGDRFDHEFTEGNETCGVAKVLLLENENTNVCEHIEIALPVVLRE